MHPRPGSPCHVTVTAPVIWTSPPTSIARAPAGAAATSSAAAAAIPPSRIPHIVPTMVDAGIRPVKLPSPHADEVRVLRDALVHYAAGRVHNRAERMTVPERLPRRVARATARPR